MYYLKNNKLGMTLIEMVISLVILGILMSATMGMIISSNNIFISTSKAALDRMVGNYVFQTIEKSTRYATHMKIADHTDALDNDYKQSFSLGDVQDAGTPQESGKLFVKTEKATEAMNLYGDGFYGNRTIQYKFEKVPNSDKHVHITVTVFREGKARFKREGTVKCVNLGLLASGMQANLVDDSAVKHPEAFNQTIYFSTNELIVSGGEDAWSLEYKVQEYMDGYNAILDEYTAKLIQAQTPLKQFVDSSSYSSQKKYSEYTTLLNERNLAFFGASSINNFNSTIKGKNYDVSKSYDANLALAGNDEANNLRYQYQCKIYKYLGYSPLATFEYEEDVPSMIDATKGVGTFPNPYYGVVVTKEQLYAGFLFKYYAKDPSVGVKLEDMPKFEDAKTFFKDSIFANDGFDEQMIILSYFIESSAKGIVNKPNNPIVTVATDKSLTLQYDSAIKYESTWTTWSKMADRFGSKAVSDGAVVTKTDEAAEGETPVTHKYSRAYSIRSTDGLQFLDLDYMKYRLNMDYEGEEFLGSVELYDALSGDNFTGLETRTTWEKTVEKLSARNLASYADNVSAHYEPIRFYGVTVGQRYIDNELKNDVAFTGNGITRITYRATSDLEEGWYYIDQGNDAGLAYAHHIFYLQAPTGDKNPTNSTTAVAKGDYVDFYIQKYSIDDGDKTGYRYKQATHTATAGRATTTTASVPIYTLNGHNYADFMLYSVDRGYWYTSPQKGILNKIINNSVNTAISWQNTINGITDVIRGTETTKIQSNKVEVLTEYNANKSLGNMTNFSLSGSSNNNGSRSYNNAFIVYNKNRSCWYYVPSSTNRMSSYLSKQNWYSQTDTPVILDLEDYGSSSKLIADIENRKLSSSILWGIDNSKDVIWLPLPNTPADLLGE